MKTRRNRTSPVEVQLAKSLGYMAARSCGRQGLCGVRPYLFTGALVVGIDPIMHRGRYCYGTMAEAIAALNAWDGEGDPPGAWIKFKSATHERLGPGGLDSEEASSRSLA